jgi:hypothetical protein
MALFPSNDLLTTLTLIDVRSLEVMEENYHHSKKSLKASYHDTFFQTV